MHRRNRSRLARSVSVALLFALSAPGAGADLAFDGASWVGTVGVKVSASKVGGLTITVPAEAAFAGTTFDLLDGGGMPMVTGTYQVPSDGKALIDLDPVVAEAFLAGWIETQLFPALGVAGSVTSLQVTSASVSAKAKASTIGIVLRLKGKVQATALLDVPPGSAIDSKVKLSLKFFAVIPPDITGTRWDGPAKSKASSPGFGSESGAGPFEMFFGPYPGFAAPGEFVFVDVLPGITLDGMTYAQSENVVTVTGFAAEVESLVEDLVELVTGVPVVMTVASDDTSVTYTPCKKAKFQSESVYDVSIPSLGQQIQVFFTIKGKATPTPGGDSPDLAAGIGPGADAGLLLLAESR